MGCFLSLLLGAQCLEGFSILSPSDHKYFNNNKEINLFSARVEPTTTQSQGNCTTKSIKFIFYDNPQYFRISLSHLTFKYITKIIAQIK